MPRKEDAALIYRLSAYFSPDSKPEKATLILGGIDSAHFREAVGRLCEAWL